MIQECKVGITGDQEVGITGDPLRGCLPQPGRPFQVLETAWSTLENIVPTHFLSDEEDRQLSAGPRARRGAAAGAGCGDPAVLEASMGGKNTVWIYGKPQEESQHRSLRSWSKATPPVIEDCISHPQNSNLCSTGPW